MNGNRDIILEIQQMHFRFVQRASPPISHEIYLYLGKDEWCLLQQNVSTKINKDSRIFGMIPVKVMLESHLNVGMFM